MLRPYLILGSGGGWSSDAPMESFFKSYKAEEVQDEVYATHEQATRGVSEYIESFYNLIRMHSSLDYQSPIDFELAIPTQIAVGES